MAEMTLPQAAAATGVDHSSLRKAAATGKLKARKVGEGRRATYYTTLAAVRAWRATVPPRGWQKGRPRRPKSPEIPTENA